MKISNPVWDWNSPQIIFCTTAYWPVMHSFTLFGSLTFEG